MSSQGNKECISFYQPKIGIFLTNLPRSFANSSIAKSNYPRSISFQYSLNGKKIKRL